MEATRLKFVFNVAFLFYRMLRSLLSAQGVNPEKIIVFIDGYYEVRFTSVLHYAVHKSNPQKI